MIIEAEKPKTRTKKRAAKTRGRLLEAALGVFSEVGLDAATIEAITQRADLGKGTFYRHFVDKNDVATCLVENAIDRLVNQLRSFETKPANLQDALEHVLDRHYRFFFDNNEEFILLFQGRLLLKLERQITEQLEEPFARYLTELELLLSPHLKEKLEITKIRRLACAVAGFVFGFFSFAMIGIGLDEVEANIKPLRQSFVRSLSSFLGG